jgi:DNA topoisomerase-1
MSKSLLIVESPAKARTIKKYVGGDFVVKASVGHVKDLPASKMGVKIEADFEPEYVIIDGKRKVIQDLKRAARNVDHIYLAPDPDREGEAIAWHIAQELDLAPDRTSRVLFNEITLKGVRAGLARPGPLDLKKYESQQARRILDRLVGYELSPILWRKVRRGLSAGRVQSVAVRLIVDREKEIEAFVPQEYWVIRCELWAGQAPPLLARLESIDGARAEVTTGAQASALVAELSGQAFVVDDVQRRKRRRAAPPPLITSRLQQEASRRYRFSARRTMTAAQQLYEGVDIGDEGAVGLITYMRTDSTRLSEDAVTMAREFIAATYGADAVPEQPNIFKARHGAQDAHEAIRPTSMRSPETVRQYLTADQYKIYRLVWERFVACQMKPAIYDVTTVDINAGRLGLRVKGETLEQAGWLDVAAESVGVEPRKKDGVKDAAEELEETLAQLPPVAKGVALALHGDGTTSEQRFTQPPPRFTEGTLVRELEDRGIGRPSTYASILSAVQQRRYVVKKEGKLHPSELGTAVTERLVEHFSDVMDPEFTARMEESLDKVEEGNQDWIELLRRFYTPFHKLVQKALVEMQTVKLTHQDVRPSEEICEECGRPMVIRRGRYGDFLSCSGFPKCRNSRPMPLGVACPRPGCDGQVVERRSKRGRKFFGCSNYQKSGCDFVVWDRPMPVPCPKCGASFLVIASKRRGGGLRCVTEGCGHAAKDEE